ncbi:MAG TPA: DNA primase [Oscillatoriaceae cyanobacterium]
MSSLLDDPVAEVRRRADIVEVVSESVVLKRSGRNYLGLCPFHGERTPSFNVNPERQIFRCFGCGEGGDVFSFVMKAQNLPFPEALKQLADRYGVPLPERRGDDDERRALREANEAAAGFYRWMLEHEEWGAKARAYLEARGIGPELQKKFQLGYAPANWDGLHRYLLQQKIPASVQESVALVRPRSSGNGYYDYFRNRIIFPIHNEAAQVVGFGARAIDPGDEPKYLNSPETPLYHKGRHLYALHHAAQSIREHDEALLMEGYMDVISAHAHGFHHAVGVLGTALTQAQARILLRHTPSKRVVLAFDADKAGQTAAERGLSTLKEVTQGLGIEVRVLAIPDSKDPDEYLRRAGAEAFAARLAEAPDLVRFQLRRMLATQDTASAEGRVRAVTACVPVLRQVDNHLMQDHYIRWLAEELGAREEAIRLEVKRGARPMAAAQRTQMRVPKVSAAEAEQLLLCILVEHSHVRETIAERLRTIAFEPANQAIREAIEALIESNPRLRWEDLLDRFAGDPVQKVVSQLMFSDYENWGVEPQRLAEDFLDTLEFAECEREIARLNAQLKQDLAPEARDALTRQLLEVVDHSVQLKHKRSNLLAANRPMPSDN